MRGNSTLSIARWATSYHVTSRELVSRATREGAERPSKKRAKKNARPEPKSEAGASLLSANYFIKSSKIMSNAQRNKTNPHANIKRPIKELKSNIINPK